MAYAVSLIPAAVRQLQRLDAAAQKKVRLVIDDLSETPRPHGCRKLAAIENAYRIRVGDYRVLYEIVDRRLLVLVIRIAHRREAYRGL